MRITIPRFLHKTEVDYDSGAKVNTLFNIMYISFDMFKKVSPNIDTKLDAWLTFLSLDEQVELLTQKDEAFQTQADEIAQLRAELEKYKGNN